MKRIKTTVGQERELYRSLNHVERRQYWQHIHNPSTPKAHRYFRAVWRARLLSGASCFGGSANDALKEMYDKPSGTIVYDNSAFLAMLANNVASPEGIKVTYEGPVPQAQRGIHAIITFPPREES